MLGADPTHPGALEALQSWASEPTAEGSAALNALGQKPQAFMAGLKAFASGVDRTALLPTPTRLARETSSLDELAEVEALPRLLPIPIHVPRKPAFPFDYRNRGMYTRQCMKFLSSIAGRLTVLTLLVCSMGHHAAAQSQYTITDLGTLPTFDSSEAGGTNASGQVAGWSTSAGIDHGFVWASDSGMLDLGTLGFSSSAAIGINDLGQAAGEVYNNSQGPFHAFFWTSDAGLTDIHVPGSFSSSEAMGINAAGQIVGRLSNPDLAHAFLWTSGAGMSDLGPMPGLTDSFATGINDAGQVVGTSSDAANGRAFLWTGDAGFTDLGTLPGFRYALASAINASGQVVGEASNDTGPIHGFLRTSDGTMMDLGTLPGFLYVQPYAINAPGVVVGQVSNGPGSGRAFIWQDGVLTDLNTLIPSESGWVLKIATGINSNGQITGTGSVGGRTGAFLLTPIP